MATTKIDVGLLDASGTASASTALLGNGTWGTASPITLISDTDISNAASYSFTGFDSSKYDSYEFVFNNVVPATDQVYFWCRFSTDGGSSYDNGASDYEWFVITTTHNNPDIEDYDQSDSEISLNGVVVTSNQSQGSDATEGGICGRAEIMLPNNSAYFTKIGWRIWGHNDKPNSQFGVGLRKTAQDTDAVQFLFSSGNIESGTIKVYGRNVS